MEVNKISVVIPVYNEPRIARTIESILQQKYTGKVEIIVIDGASTDDTLSVINRYRNVIDILVSERDNGIFDALNKGIHLATGDVIALLGADDCYDNPNVFNQVVSVLDNDQVDGCYADLVYVDSRDRVVRYWRSGKYKRINLYFGWMIPHFTLFLRKSIYQRYGVLDIQYKVSADYDFILKLLMLHRVRLTYISSVFVRMTLGGYSNRSVRNILKGNLGAYQSWLNNNFAFGYLVPILKPLRKLWQYILKNQENRNLRVTILTQYFYPDIAATGQILSEFAEQWVKDGFKVHVYTAYPSYTQSLPAIDHLPVCELWNQIYIRRLWKTDIGKNKTIGKIIDSLTFFVSTLIYCLRLNRQEIVLVVTNPPILPILVYFLSRLKKFPYLVLIHDQYPEIAENLGYLKKNGAMVKLWKQINRWVYYHADFVIVLGRCMRKMLTNIYFETSTDRIEVITNSSNTKKMFYIPENKNIYLDKYGVRNKFVIFYGGNLGLFHDIETILFCAKELVEYKNILFLFIGGGGKLPVLKEMITKYNLNNVNYYPYINKEEIKYVLSFSSLSLISLSLNSTGLSVPSKLYDTIAVGNPVICIMSDKCETAMVVREKEIGFVVSPGDVPGLKAAILRLYKDNQLRRLMSDRAVKLAQEYDVKYIAGKFGDLFRKVKK